MASRLLELILRTTKQGEDISKTSAQLGEFKKGIGGAVQELTGFNLTSIGVAGALTGIAVGLKKAFDASMEYAEQVRDLSRVSGASTEETSRLIQTADDLKVSYQTLQQAAKKLALEGVALTTEELAKASDEYLAIADAGARAKYAFERFGRAGEDMTKILEAGGDALRKMAAEQDKSRVLSKKQVDAARELEKGWDKLQDRAQGLTLTIGNELVGALNSALGAVEQLEEMSRGYSSVLMQHEGEMRKTAGTYEEYITEMQRAAGVVGLEIDASGNLVKAFKSQYGTTYQVIEANFALTAGQMEANKAMSAAPMVVDDAADAMRNYHPAVTSAAGATTTLASVSKSLVADALKPLTAEILNEKIMAGLTGDALLIYAQKTGQLDEKSYATLTALQKLTKEYDLNKDGLIDASEAARGYWDALNKLDGKMVNITITTNRQGEKWGGESEGFSSGGSFVIPPGYPNDSYPLGMGKFAQSGEVVTVTPTTTYNANFSGPINVNNGMDAQTLANQITSYWQRKSRY